MGKYKEQAIKQVIEILDAEGKRILSECESEVTYTHRTHNLYDSYAYGIYLNGKLVKKGYLSASPLSTENKKWYGKEVAGREQIDNFLNSEYKAQSGIDLVVVAAMPYAHALENASSGQHTKYRVISMAHDKLVQVKSSIKGLTVSIINASRVV